MANAQSPLAGSGLSGSVGPEITATLRSLPQSAPGIPISPTETESSVNFTAPLKYSPRVIEALVTSVPFASATPNAIGAERKGDGIRTRLNIAPNSTFITDGDQDLGAATDGTYILQSRSESTFSIYSMSGTDVETLAYTDLYCGSQPLPICAMGPLFFPGDNRVIYDPVSQRWVISSLWVDPNGPVVVPTASLAVSQSNDPTGSWYVYQFPNCGTSDKTIGDQPRLGFNNQWIVVTSSCSLSTDASLNVFDKQALYAGENLSLNANWFTFADSSNVYNKDNPVRTYAQTINNREYLTFVREDTKNSEEQVVYSHVEGAADAPVFYSETDAVDTPSDWNGGGPAVQDAPGCTACVGGETNGTIQSSGVYQLSNGEQYILSTNVLIDNNEPNADDVLATATSDSGTAETMDIFPTAGEGGIASEIGMPSVQSLADTADVIFDYSSPSYYPGVWAAQWNLDNNHVDYVQAIQEGNVVPPPCNPPSGCTATRIADFIDAFATIPGSSQFLVAGDVLNSNAQNDREIFWMNLSLAMPCTTDTYGYCAVEESSAITSYQYCVIYVNGKPMHIRYPDTTATVYNVYDSASLLESATETSTSNGQCPPGYTIRWSPNEPKVYYSDPNLP